MKWNLNETIQIRTTSENVTVRFAITTDFGLVERNPNSTQLNVYLPIRENISTTVQHQMAGRQRGLSLSKLATHGYNNVITTHIKA